MQIEETTEEPVISEEGVENDQSDWAKIVEIIEEKSESKVKAKRLVIEEVDTTEN